MAEFQPLSCKAWLFATSLPEIWFTTYTSVVNALDQMAKPMIWLAFGHVNMAMMAYAQSQVEPWPSLRSKRLRFAGGRMRHHLFQPGDMTPQKNTDRAQWNACISAISQTRDRAAFEALFMHFGPRVKAYLMRLGANAGLAEDLAQEAMLAIWRKAHLFDAAKASAGTWIFTIARNLRIDSIRRERRPEFNLQDPALVPEPETPPDMRLIKNDEEIRVRGALSDLSPEQVQVVEMSFFSDKTHSVIADELGLPLGTVKSRLRLAMARIRSSLEETS